jgi:hypothetical protein
MSGGDDCPLPPPRTPLHAALAAAEYGSTQGPPATRLLLTLLLQHLDLVLHDLDQLLQVLPLLLRDLKTEATCVTGVYQQIVCTDSMYQDRFLTFSTLSMEELIS